MQTFLRGVIGPIHHWTPSIAPSGMTFYHHDAVAEWQSSLFVGALAKRHLARLQVQGDEVLAEERWLAGRDWRIRDVEVGPGRALWVLTDHADGRLLRLTPE